MVRIKGARLGHYISACFIFLASSMAAQAATVSERPEISAYRAQISSSTNTQILRKEIELNIEESGNATRRTYVAILLNDEASIRDYSQIEINHNSYSSEFNIDFARVHNGEEIKYLQDDAISNQNLSSENFFYDNERTIFSLPTLRQGAIIELQYTTKSKQPTIPGHFNSQASFYWWEGKAGNAGYRLDPVAESIVKVSAPQSMALDYRQSEKITNKPKYTNEEGIDVWQWHVSDLPETKPENRIPEDINVYPIVYLSTLKGWKDLNSWASQLFEPHVSNDAKVLSVAEEIAKKYSSEKQKIEAVFRFMEDNIRYVYAHVGRNGYEPHSALDVLSNGYGDCKDQTVLTVSILRALGIDAYPALISSFGGNMLEDMPRNYFDHMFVYIPETETRGAVWFDTTGSKLDFPGIHWSHEGEPALILDGSLNTMTTVALDNKTEHLADINLSFDKANNTDISIRLDVVYSGLMGQNVASMLQYAPDKDALLKDILGPIYPKANLEQVGYRKLEDLKDTYEISADYIAKGAWEGEPKPLNIFLGLSQFVGLVTNLNDIEEPEKRTHPLQTTKPVTLNLEARIPHPGGDYAPITVTSSPDYNSSFFDVKQSSSVNSNGDFLINASFDAEETIVSVEDYENYYRAAQNILELPNWFVSYQINENALELSKLDSLNDSSDLSEIIESAEVYLNNGAFEDALKLAEKAIELDSLNPKAHYLRGVALGYQQQFDASNEAFAKALELGYEL